MATIGGCGPTSSSQPRERRAATGHSVSRLRPSGSTRPSSRPGPFVHGFTYSHSPVGAAVAREVLRILEAESLVEASATKGERLLTSLAARLEGHNAVGDVRGKGLLVGVELVADVETRAAFPRMARLTERVVAAARERGVLVYSGTGNADGVDGDTILLGPPFVVSDAQLDRIVEVVGEAIDVAVAEVAAAAAR